MNEEKEVVATFSVSAGTTVEFSLDTEGMTDREIIAAVIDASGDYADTGLCHHCAGKVIDPEIQELSGLTVGGREIDVEGPRR